MLDQLIRADVLVQRFKNVSIVVLIVAVIALGITTWNQSQTIVTLREEVTETDRNWRILRTINRTMYEGFKRILKKHNIRTLVTGHGDVQELLDEPVMPADELEALKRRTGVVNPNQKGMRP